MSVILPVRDGAREVSACLDALAAQTYRGRSRVIVVDNGSRDGTAAVARRHPLAPTVLEEPTPGAYRARNRGLAEVDGSDVVALTDVDCRPDPTWLAEGVAALADADLAGGTIEQVVEPPGTVWSRYDAATYLDQAELVRLEGFAATANLFVAPGVLAHLGGFAADLRSSGDLDLGRRATAAGFRLVVAPRAVVRHRTRAGASDLWRLHRRLGAGWSVLAERDGGPPWWRDDRLRLPLGWAVDRTVQRGDPLRFRQVALPHAVAMGARLVGRVTGRS